MTDVCWMCLHFHWDVSWLCYLKAISLVVSDQGWKFSLFRPTRLGEGEKKDPIFIPRSETRFLHRRDEIASIFTEFWGGRGVWGEDISPHVRKTKTNHQKLTNSHFFARFFFTRRPWKSTGGIYHGGLKWGYLRPRSKIGRLSGEDCGQKWELFRPEVQKIILIITHASSELWPFTLNLQAGKLLHAWTYKGKKRCVRKGFIVLIKTMNCVRFTVRQGQVRIRWLVPELKMIV